MSDQPRVKEQGAVSDAVAGNWVDSTAPAWTRAYLRLSRADRPIGTWLLWLPCLMGGLLASAQLGALSPQAIWIMIGSGLGAFLMRGAGCTWNDLTDHEFDAKVARTKSRPLPSGQVTRRQAYVWMILQIALGGVILLTFPPIAIVLGLAALIPAAIYPFAKRFTWWPQLFLGLAFNWGALLCYAAIWGELTSAAIFLYIACIAWTLFYDTIYAHQDKEDDALIGVKSTARLFDTDTPRWLKRFLILTVIFMAAACIDALVDRSFLTLIVASCGAWAMGLHMTVQMARLNIDDPENCMMIFRSNRDAGLIAGLFFAVAIFL